MSVTTTTKRKTDLSVLAKQVNAAHHEVINSLRTAIHHAKEAGDKLREAKMQVRHGKWLKWLKCKFDSSPETARVYMRISKFWEFKIEPALEEDQNLTIEQARLLLRPERDPIETGVLEHARPWAEMSRENLLYNFRLWLENLPDEGIIYLHENWEATWELIMVKICEVLDVDRDRNKNST